MSWLCQVKYLFFYSDTQRSQSNKTEPKSNRTQSNSIVWLEFDCFRNQTELDWNFSVSLIKFDYRTQSNTIDPIGSILLGMKNKMACKSIINCWKDFTFNWRSKLNERDI